MNTARFARELITYGSRRIGEEMLTAAIEHTLLSKSGSARSSTGEVATYDVLMRDGSTRRLIVTTYVSFGEDADVDMEAQWS